MGRSVDTVFMDNQCKSLLVIITGLFLLFFPPDRGYCRQIEMPITIDYPFLRSLVISTSFRDPVNTAVLVDEAEGCRKVAVSEPRFSMEGAFVRMETKVSVRMGALLGKKCRFTTHWDGYVSLVMEPQIDPRLWRLGFRVVESKVHDAEHKPAWVVGLIWKMIQGAVFEYLGGITVDLAPPVQELRAFLPEVFPKETLDKVGRFIDGMHPGPVRVDQNSIRIPILSEMEETEPIRLGEVAEPEVLTQEALARLTGNWEDWDAFLVYLVTSLRSAPLSGDDRDTLFTALLEARYGFVKELTDRSLTDAFVRDQFLSTWMTMSPVFRSMLAQESSGRLLGYLAFFTASDALKSLDEIGSSMGMDISRNGLIRLARLMADERLFEPVYSVDFDADLRNTLALGNAPEVPEEPTDKPLDEPAREPEPQAVPPDRESDNESDEGSNEGSPPEGGQMSRIERILMRIFCATASICWAADSKPSEESLKDWLVSRENAETYLQAVRGMLEEAIQKAFKEGDSEEHRRLLRTMVMATAWQESCWRQFHVHKGQLTYIRSYNGTSVGLMQINERVWRGLYKVDALRWNIRYNAAAGCDILNLYLTKYILKQKDKFLRDGKMDPDLVSRSLYAMYNGGPGEFRKFLARHGHGKYYLSDNLFWEKYQWVNSESWDKVEVCLFGE
jgi:hypothetical protein